MLVAANGAAGLRGLLSDLRLIIADFMKLHQISGSCPGFNFNHRDHLVVLVRMLCTYGLVVVCVLVLLQQLLCFISLIGSKCSVGTDTDKQTALGTFCHDSFSMLVNLP